MNRVEKAIEYHDRGFNCAQAVACAFADVAGLDEQTLFKLTEGLGLGAGCMEGTCGALSGAAVVLGLVNSTGHTETPASQADTYKLPKQPLMTFKEKNQSVLCKELKGVETKEVLRSCPGCIEDATVILENMLADRQEIIMNNE